MSLSDLAVSAVFVGLIGLLACLLLTVLLGVILMLYRRVEILEAERRPEPQGTRKRMPYEAAEEVIDAMAVLDAAEEKNLLQLEYVQNVKAHLAKALQTGTVAARAATTGDAGMTPARGAKRAAAPVRDEREL